MAYSFECLLGVNEVVVKVALVLYVFCNYGSAVAYKILCTTILRPAPKLAASCMGGW